MSDFEIHDVRPGDGRAIMCDVIIPARAMWEPEIFPRGMQDNAPVEEWVASWEDSILNGHKQGKIYRVAIINEKIVGMLAITPPWFKEMKEDFSHEILSLFVSPDYQNRGIGSALLQTALKIAKDDLQLDKVCIQALEKNFGARRLYEKYGAKLLEDYRVTWYYPGNESHVRPNVGYYWNLKDA